MATNQDHPLTTKPPGGLCWRRSERRSRAHEAQAHRELVVLLALSGRAEYLIDNRRHLLRRGDLLWAFAGQAHFLLSDSEDFDMWVFLISDRLCGPQDAGFPPVHFDDAPEDAVPRTLPDSALEELDGLAERIRPLAEPEALATGLRWWLLRAWAHWRDASAGKPAGNLHPGVAQAARILREDPTRPLDELARDCGLSSGRLSRLFRQQTGRGLVTFRTEQKMRHVETLMRTNQHGNLLRSAYDAGFGSYSQFYRAFVDIHGMPPRDYFKD